MILKYRLFGAQLNSRCNLELFSLSGSLFALDLGFKELRRKKNELRVKREQETAFWTTPGMRPLAEPPAMPWSKILREKYSEAGLSALFANDPERRSRAKDLWGECIAVEEYIEWLQMMKDDTHETDEERQRFYSKLHWEVSFRERSNANGRWRALYHTATELGKFEHQYLDPDGGTTNIEHLLHSGKISLPKVDEIETKYRHLAPVGYGATALGMFEYEFEVATQGLSRIKKELMSGNDIFYDAAREAQEKYGYLVDDFLDRVKTFERRFLGKDGVTVDVETMKDRLDWGEDIFENFGDPEVLQKYGHLKQYYNEGDQSMDLYED